MTSSRTASRRASRPRDLTLALVAALAAALAFAGAADAKTPRPTSAKADASSFLVGFRTQQEANATVAAAGDSIKSHVGGQVALVKLKAGWSLAAKLKEYRARKHVLFAEPNYLVDANVSPPDDPYYGTQWNMLAINALAGWNIFPGSYGLSNGVKIAIVDTGIDYLHPDLAGRVLTGLGANCLSGTCTPSAAADDYGHGTHVAGIAAAITNNGIGVTGLAISSQLIPVKVLDSGGMGTMASVASGILWAVNHGARVINMSLGGYGASSTVCSAVSNAVSHNVVVVAAAGNNGTTQPSYPASCAGAIGVAATDTYSQSPDWSNYGKPNVFISGPGVDIFSSFWSSGTSTWTSLSGTSMASPHVAGLAALLTSQAPTRTVTDVRRLLARTAQKVGANFYPVTYGSDVWGTCVGCTWHPYYGYGLIDVAAALTGFPPTIGSVSPTSAHAGTTIAITGTNLETVGTVDFNGTPATPQILSTTSLKVVVPTGATTGSMSLTNPAGSAARSFTVTPTITGYAPAGAPAGATVSINGLSLSGVTAVTFNGIAAAIGLHDDSHVVATVPVTAATGPIRVVTAGGTATGPTFKVQPAVTDVAPLTGFAGQVITVTGTGFRSPSVNFNGVAASVSAVAADGTSLHATVPAGATSGPVAVTTVGGSGASSSSFVMRPAISSLSPASGTAGSTVTVSGTGLGGATNVLFWDGAGDTISAASVTPVSANQVRAVVPATARKGPLAVVTPGGTSAASVVPFSPVPKVVSLSPADGAIGTTVVLSGSNFTGASSVKFGALTDPSFVVNSALQITAHVPAGFTAGTVSVTTPAGTGSSTTAFALTHITAITPSTATAGTTLTITGTGLGSTTTVHFPGASTPSIPTAVTASSFKVVVPPDAISGQLAIDTAVLTNLSGGPVFKPLPRIVVGPAAHQVGDTVVLSGTNLTGVSLVKLGALILSPGTGYTAVGPTEIDLHLPVAGLTGQISVTTPAGSATSATALKIVPTIVSLGASAAPAGTVLHLTGATFSGTSAVRFAGTGGAATVAASYAIVTNNALNVTVPTTAISGPIRITNAGGPTDSVALTVLPHITSLSTASGAVGSTLTINGTGLYGTTAVQFGGAVSAPPTTKTATSVQVVVPAGATSGPVTVAAPGGSSTSATPFTVTFSVSGMTPSIAPYAYDVALTGVGLVGVTAVKFNGHPGVITSNNGTTIHVTTPDASAGGISGTVTVWKGVTTNIAVPGVFTLLTISGITPNPVLAGSDVTITGTGFTGATAVSFAGTAVTALTISGGGTQITLTAPSSFTGGNVVVTAAGGATTTLASVVAMSVTGVSATSGVAGDSITIAGSHFTGATGVSFAGIAATGFHVDSDTQITATVPAADALGPVSVTGPAGTVSGPSFHVLPPVVLNEVAADVTGNDDIVELRVAAAGSLGGMDLVQDPTVADPDGSVLATLPAISAAAGELVVIHLNAPAGVADETSDMTSCTDPTCSAGAWDVVANGTLAFGDLVLELQIGGRAVDAVPFFSSTLPSVPASFTTSYQALGAALWATGCSGSCTNGAFDWNTMGTDVTTGLTAQRDCSGGAGADANVAGDWCMQAATVGSPN